MRRQDPRPTDDLADPLAILDREPVLPVRSLKSRVQLCTKQALKELQRMGQISTKKPRPSQRMPAPLVHTPRHRSPKCFAAEQPCREEHACRNGFAVSAPDLTT